MAFVRGIDVSKWQPTVDWPKVKAAGIAFAVAKASQATWPDALFAKHWQGAKDAGLLRGAYHFYAPDVDPLKQLDTYLKALGKDLGDLPPVLDIEAKTTNAAQLGKGALAWLTEAEKRTGRKPLIYTAAWYWNTAMLIGGKYPEWAAGYPLWVAAYPVAAGAPSLDDIAAGKFKPLLPKSWTDWAVWQYSEKGRVDGVVTDGKPANTDLNIYKGSLEDLGKWLSLDSARLAGLPSYEPMVSFSVDFAVVEPSYGDAATAKGASVHLAEALETEKQARPRRKPAAKKPTARKPVKKPAARKSTIRKPASKKAATRKKAAAKRPPARKAARPARKAAAKKPAARKAARRK